MKRAIIAFIFGFSLTLSAQNRFSQDLVLKIIYTHQYENHTASLYPFLHNPIIKYREAACMAFASIQDSTAADSLLKVIKTDTNKDVITAAIYSVGQLRLESVAVKLIALYDEKALKAYKPELMEAIGKCAKTSQLVFFNSVQIKKGDTALQSAYMYACFQAYRRSNSIIKEEKWSGIVENLNQIQKSNPNPAVQKHYYALKKTFLSDSEQAKPPVFRKDNMPKMYAQYEDFIARVKNDSTDYELLNHIEQYEFSKVQLLLIALNDSFSKRIRSFFAEMYFARMPHPDEKVYNQFLDSRDLALVGMACEHMRKDTVFMRSRGNMFMEKLRRIQAELQMPKDFEAWVETEKVLCILEGREYVYQSWFTLAGYSNPIDWNYVSIIPQNQRIRIKTNKGSIILVCKVNEAPASVAHFLKLVDSGYYNGKYFHRMVADFVVQGGCPRGDGWGTLDWTQRSEFSNYLKYKPGSVGLASAGKDSEGVQFFITHTYTAHLDGRYTIFAEVEDGMSVVNRLIVGDRILSIEKI